MITPKRCYALAGISMVLAAVGAQAQPGQSGGDTMIILPDAAADTADTVTENVYLPAESDDGQDAEQDAHNGEHTSGALDALTEAQVNAAEAADFGLQNARDAVEGNREELGRGGMPEDLPIPQDLPDQVPDEIPAGPENGPPEGTDLPTPPTPPVGG